MKNLVDLFRNFRVRETFLAISGTWISNLSLEILNAVSAMENSRIYETVVVMRIRVSRERDSIEFVNVQTILSRPKRCFG